MGELWFVGLGLGDERDLSVRALELLKTADVLFAEAYTSTVRPGSLDRLKALLGHPVTLLSRTEVESERPVLDALARHPRVVLLVAGDPFAATTHVALRLAAERAGHSWHYLPNASILTAAASFLGLQHYRFGRPVSLPFPSPGFEPTSPVEQIGRNRAAGLHTLVLLDLRPDEGRHLEATEALGILLERDPKHTAVAPDRPLCVVARMGTESPGGWYGEAQVLRTLDFGPPPHAIVVLAPELHFEEQAALESFRVTRRPR